MNNTLKAGLFDMAEFEDEDIEELRRDLAPESASALRRLVPWAAGLLLGVASLAVARRFLRS